MITASRIEIPVSAETVEWDGRNINGSPFPVGNYTFELTSYSKGEPVPLTVSAGAACMAADEDAGSGGATGPGGEE